MRRKRMRKRKKRGRGRERRGEREREGKRLSQYAIFTLRETAATFKKSI